MSPCPLINHWLLFLNGKFLIKFGSGKDVTSKIAAVGISKLKFLKACVEARSAGLGTGSGLRKQSAGKMSIFFLCTEM